MTAGEVQTFQKVYPAATLSCPTTASLSFLGTSLSFKPTNPLFWGLNKKVEQMTKYRKSNRRVYPNKHSFPL